MKNYLKALKINDFIPPIAGRITTKIKRKLGLARNHPFDCIPPNLKPEWFLDIGANIGDVTMAALKSFPDSKVICFEPVQQTFQMLKNRLAPYEKRVSLFNLALSDENAEGQINITSFHGANSILPQSTLHKQATGVTEIKTEKIKLVRLDEIFDQFPTKHIDVMKIDVEGFELNVLNGGFEFISKYVDTIIIEIALLRSDVIAENSVADIFLFMKRAGFSLINAFDLEPNKAHPNLLLSQMDCVFRSNRFLQDGK